MKVRPSDCNHRLSKFVVADENDHAPAMPIYMKAFTNDYNHRLSIFVVADEDNHAPAMPVISIFGILHKYFTLSGDTP